MIEYKSGDILEDQAEALVNTANCVGVMGRGIALQFNRHSSVGQWSRGTGLGGRQVSNRRGVGFAFRCTCCCL